MPWQTSTPPNPEIHPCGAQSDAIGEEVPRKQPEEGEVRIGVGLEVFWKLGACSELFRIIRICVFAWLFGLPPPGPVRPGSNLYSENRPRKCPPRSSALMEICWQSG